MSLASPIDRIGELIHDEQARLDWRRMVFALHEASLPGNPLEGWVFHGTEGRHEHSLVHDGMTITTALAEDADGANWTHGTHWAMPKVAAYYAEDWLESSERPSLDLVIVATRLSELEACGEFFADGQTVDAPIVSRLEHDEATAHARWLGSEKRWQDCMEAYGSFVVLGPVGPEGLHILRTEDDVNALVSSLMQSPGPHG